MESFRIEKEYKMLIEEECYRRIRESLELETVVQTNHYYDTHDRKIAMRIRTIDDRAIFTMKRKTAQGNEEYEFDVEKPDLSDPRIKELLGHFGISDPVYQGQMTTERSTLMMKYGEFCLDRSVYGNKTDYEIEFELYDANVDRHEEFDQLLKKAGIEGFIENHISKYERFLRECVYR